MLTDWLIWLDYLEENNCNTSFLRFATPIIFGIIEAHNYYSFGSGYGYSNGNGYGSGYGYSNGNDYSYVNGNDYSYGNGNNYKYNYSNPCDEEH